MKYFKANKERRVSSFYRVSRKMRRRKYWYYPFFLLIWPSLTVITLVIYRWTGYIRLKIANTFSRIFLRARRQNTRARKAPSPIHHWYSLFQCKLNFIRRLCGIIRYFSHKRLDCSDFRTLKSSRAGIHYKECNENSIFLLTMYLIKHLFVRK